jgi:hypothetical protein
MPVTAYAAYLMRFDAGAFRLTRSSLLMHEELPTFLRSSKKSERSMKCAGRLPLYQTHSEPQPGGELLAQIQKIFRD